jgi:hypothetical protein
MALERLFDPYCLLIAFKEGRNRVGSYWVNPVMLCGIDESLKHSNFSLLQAAYYTGRWGKQQQTFNPSSGSKPLSPCATTTNKSSQGPTSKCMNE